MLLTNVATATLDDTLERARLYAPRWSIEVFHPKLKTGCQIEERQLGYAVRLENFLAIDLVVTWRIFHLTMLGRMDPEAPCTVFFSNPEWKALYRLRHETAHVPNTPHTLREATLWVGFEGGFQGRRSDGLPRHRGLVARTAATRRRRTGVHDLPAARTPRDAQRVPARLPAAAGARLFVNRLYQECVRVSLWRSIHPRHRLPQELSYYLGWLKHVAEHEN
jgi:hypothetical protein